MKKTIYAIAAVSLVLSGCSQKEEPAPVAGNEKVIGFSATAPKHTRADATTTTGLKSFVVYAFTDSKLIMDGVTVSKEGSAWTYSPEVYWPSTPVNFFAVSPDIRTAQTPEYSETINNVSCGSTDLLYAVSMNQYERSTPVPLEFRHAMSRVAINLSCTNNKYQVKVSYVVLKNISLQGDYKMPMKTTAANDSTSVGVWSNLGKTGDALVFYPGSGEAVSLTPDPTDLTEGNLEASFFVPQDLTPLAVSQQGVFSGSYVEIDCEIFDKETGSKIWPTENTPAYLKVPQSEAGRMIFPLTTEVVKSWKQGYSYSYNIVINNTYTLDKIEFDPRVVNYTEVTPY